MIVSLPPVYLLRRYLSAHGWVRQQLAVAGLDLFTPTEPGSDTIEIPVPAHGQSADAERRVMFALRTLSDIEDRPLEAVAAAVIGSAFDIIEASVPSTMLTRESIGLGVAATFVTKERHLMMHAAAAELAGQSDNIERDSRTYADNCRFGHTFYGSFGFRVMSPLGDLDVGALPTPNPRAIVNRIRHGIAAVYAPVHASNPAPMVATSSSLLNASGYRDLAEILEKAEAPDVSFRFILSPALPDSLPPTGLIRLPTAAAGLVREAADMMQEAPPPGEHRISGRIITLASRHVPADLLHPEGRKIDVSWDSPQFGEVKVRVLLSPQDYTKAIDAHGRGLMVIVEGALATRGKTGFSVDNPTSFSVGNSG